MTTIRTTEYSEEPRFFETLTIRKRRNPSAPLHIFVEGKSDADVYESVFEELGARVEWYPIPAKKDSGKTASGMNKNLVARLTRYANSNKELCCASLNLGIIDKDLNPLLKKINFDNSLLLTDFCDMETTILKMPEVKDKLVKQMAREKDRWKVKPERLNVAFQEASENSFKLGLIKLSIRINEIWIYGEPGLHPKVDSICDSLDGKVWIDEDKLFSHYFDNMEKADPNMNIKDFRKMILDTKNQVIERHKEEIDFKWRIIRGHDLINIYLFSANLERKAKEKDVIDILPYCFGLREMIRTRLGICLIEAMLRSGAIDPEAILKYA